MLRFLLTFIIAISFLSPTDCMANKEADSLYIASIVVKGNSKTRTSIILREITFEPGHIFLKSDFIRALERSRQNVFNRNLFVWVKASFEQNEEMVKVIIEVQERLYLLPLPVLDLADRSFNEWWYNRNHDFKRVIYGLQVNHSNLTGNADILKLTAYGGFIPYFELSYGRPYIDKRQRMGLRGGVFYSVQKSFAYRTWDDKLDFVDTEERNKERRGAFMEYSLRNALYHFHTIRLGYTQSSISDSVVSLNSNYFGIDRNDLTYMTLKYDYRFDQLDNKQYPLNGQLLALRMTHYAGQGFNHSSLGLSYHRFTPIKGKFYWDFGFKGQLSFPKKQLYNFVSGFGFRNTLVRGYDLNVIDGQHYGLLKSNLKYQLFNKTLDISRVIKLKQFSSMPIGIYARAFFDAGYVKNYFPEFSNSTLSNRLIYGGGLGLDWVTFYDTAVKVNFSVNQFGTGKVYFGVHKGI